MQEKIRLLSFNVPGYGTALPGSPNDGDLFVLVDSLAAPTYSWLLRYVAAKASNKWVFLGGAPLLSFNASGSTTTSATYVDPGANASVTAPVAGLYLVRWAGSVSPASNSAVFIAPKFGAAAAADSDSASPFTGSAIDWVSGIKSLSMAASDVLKMQFRSNGSVVATARDLYVDILPIAIGG